MKNKIKIRKAKRGDLREIDNIFRKEYAKSPYNEKWPKDISIAKIKKYFARNFVFVLEIDNKIKGFIIGHIELWDKGKTGFIDEVVVLQKFQGKGHGKKLMEHLNKYFRRYKIKSIDLITNPKSKAFKIYKKLGYNEFKDFIYMTKNLK